MRADTAMFIDEKINKAFESYNNGLITICELSKVVVTCETLSKIQNKQDEFETAAHNLSVKAQEIRKELNSII